MKVTVGQDAQNHLATLARRLVSGRITNEQFENELVPSDDAAVHDINFHGIWPLQDDCTEHELFGRWAATKDGLQWTTHSSPYGVRSGQAVAMRSKREED